MDINNPEKYEYYVYEHIMDGKVFYVGKGKGDRAQDKNARSGYWKALVGERVDEIEIVIRGYFIEEVDALTFEFMLINKYVDEGLLLVNMIYNGKADNVVDGFGEEASEILKKEAIKRLDIMKQRKAKIQGKLAFLNGSDDFKTIMVRKRYLNSILTAKDKHFLCEDLHLLDERNKLRKWPTVRKYLERAGYNVENKIEVVNGMRKRVSIITVKE